MSLSWDTLRAIPHLRSYEQALNYHDNVVPIRRRANDNRPLGKRSHYYYIWKDDGTGSVIHLIRTIRKHNPISHNANTPSSTYLQLSMHGPEHHHFKSEFYNYELADQHHVKYPKGTIHIGYGTGRFEERTPVASYLPNGVVRIHVAQVGWRSNMSRIDMSACDMLSRVTGIGLHTKHTRTWAECHYYHPDTGTLRKGHLPISRVKYMARHYTPEEAFSIHQQGIGSSDFIMSDKGPVFINPLFPTQYRVNRAAMANKLASLKPLLVYIRGLQCLQDEPIVRFDDYMLADLGLVAEQGHPTAKLPYSKTRSLRLKKIDARELVTTAMTACNIEGDDQAPELLRAAAMCMLYAYMPTHEALRMAIKDYCHAEVLHAVRRTDGNVLKCVNSRFISNP